jgi:pantoate--beta-alanine ligase
MAAKRSSPKKSPAKRAPSKRAAATQAANTKAPAKKVKRAKKAAPVGPRVELIASRQTMQALAFEHRALGDTIGFVPTMGALHEGHLALVREARKRADVVVVSIFVNPKQFDQVADLRAYPRTLDDDLDQLSAEGVDFAFVPAVDQIYPPSFDTLIKAGALAKRFEGRSRKGHFDGMLTVVSKLLLIVQPHFAVFGEKDYQQLLLVRRLVNDLSMPVEIVPMPVIREPDGLALSSRNTRLTKRDRRHATALYRALNAAQTLCFEGERRAAPLRKIAREVLMSTPRLEIDYADVVDPFTLEPLRTLERPGRLIMAASFPGRQPVRLLDNGPLFLG